MRQHSAPKSLPAKGVGVSLTVTPLLVLWHRNDGHGPADAQSGCGDSMAPSAQGPSYLAAVLSGYNQKGLPAFSIYGHDVQDSSDTSIPNDVREKLLLFAKAGLAVAEMRGKSYLSLGSVSMGIAGSVVNESLFQDYLGMRNEYVDMTEFLRRMDEQIYDREEYQARAPVGQGSLQGKAPTAMRPTSNTRASSRIPSGRWSSRWP